MTTHTGTATGLKNLLSIVKDKAVLEGWTAHDYLTGQPAPYTDVLLLEGPGYGTGYEVYFGIRTFENAANSYYSLETRGYTNYISGLSFTQQPGAHSASVFTNVWDTTMTYWLYISDRRILLVVKCSNTYHSLYAGFFNPFANPTEYPYPAYFAGDSASAEAFGALSYNSRSVAFPGANAAYLRDVGGLWRNVTVYDSSASWGFQGQSDVAYTVWPYNTPGGADGGDDDGNGYHPPNLSIAPLPGTTDTLFLTNTYLCGCGSRMGVYGVLEGVYWVPGNLLSAEQTLTFNSQDYTVFIGLSRSVETPSQFYAVLEV